MSLSRLNEWIAKTYPQVPVALYKGEGYFYWIDADDDAADSAIYNNIGFEFDSIYVCAFSHAPMEWWQAQVRSQINAYLEAVAINYLENRQ